jgi:hypothetical protein
LQASDYFFLGFRDTNANGVYDAGEPVTNSGTPLQETAFTQQGDACANMPSASSALSLP